MFYLQTVSALSCIIHTLVYLLELTLSKLTFWFVFFVSWIGVEKSNCAFSSVRDGMHCDRLARLCLCTDIFNFGELFHEKILWTAEEELFIFLPV